MLKDVMEARPAGDYRLWLRFEDGVAGEVDIARLVPFGSVLAAWHDPARFGEVRVDSELGTVV